MSVFDKDEMDEIREQHEQWTEQTLEPFLDRGERKDRFATVSNMEVDRIYTPEDIEEIDYTEDIGVPGEPPYTRGPYPTMYRGRTWTMRQFAGFGTAEETNERFHYLIDNGQTGLSTSFDMPSLMGLDSDHRMSKDEVGKEGVAVDTLRDMEILFDGIDISDISTSFTINPSAPVIYAMYIALADQQDIAREEVRGTLQNDMFKEFIAQKEWVIPPEPSLDIVTDTIEFAVDETPKFHPVSISGYHIREAGSTAAQEAAFTLADGFAYAEDCLNRGLDIDEFAPLLSFFFNSHNSVFEEVAKFRASRRIYARIMEDWYDADKPESKRLKFHTQTAGQSLTAQQPLNNIVRVTLQALAAVLGGSQSLHTNSYDEALALPSEKAVRVALRTQQIIAEESGTADIVDPMGGSFAVEKLTNEMEAQIMAYLEEIKDKFLAGLADAAEDLTVGDPLLESTDLGPKVTAEQVERTMGYIKEAKEEGAAFVTGGTQPDDEALSDGCFVAPTLIDGIDHDSDAVQEEIFGPVQEVFSWSDYDEMIELANDVDYGLAAGVISEDITKAHQCAKDIEAGTVWVNTYNDFPAGQPFGGHKQSGMGREIGQEAVDHYTQTKSIGISLE